MSTKPIEKAVSGCGTQAALASAIGVSAQMVWQWVNARRPVPAKYCLPIEAASGVSRYELRPDVFGDPPKSRRQAA